MPSDNFFVTILRHFLYKKKIKNKIKLNCIVLKRSHNQNNLILDITFKGISTQILDLKNIYNYFF